MNAAADKQFRAKVEVLLGERKGASQDRAVRLREIESILRSTTGLVGTIDPKVIKPIVDKAVDDALEDYTPPGLDPIIGRIDQLEQDAENAKQDILNAIAQADAANAYTDEKVGLVYADIADLQTLAGQIDGRVTDVRNDLDAATDQIALDLQAGLDAANAYTDSGFAAYNTTIQGQFESVAGQIEQLTAALTSTNLVGNGLFALGSTGWTLSNATVLARADQTGLGAAAPHPNLVQLAAATAASISTDLNAFTVDANDRVQFRFMAAATATRTLTVTLAWEDGAGNPIGTPAVETLTISPANSWKVYGKQVDPPDTAVGATLTIAKASGGAAALITGIEVSTVNIALEARVTAIEAAYVTETEVTAMVTSQVTTKFNDAVALVSAEATARSNADIAIGNRITLVEAKNGTQDATISAQATAIADAKSATSQLDESVKATFGAAELISDPVFAYGLARWLPGTLVDSTDIALKDTAAAASWVFQTMPAAKALRIRSGATGQAQSLVMPVKPGDVLDFSFDYARASNGVVPAMQYRFRKVDNTFVGTGAPGGQTVQGAGSAKWLTAMETGIVVPEEAVSAEVRIWNYANAVNSCWVTNINLRRRQAVDHLTVAEINTVKQAQSDADAAFTSFKTTMEAAVYDEDTGLGALADQIDERYTKAETDSAISAVSTKLTAQLSKDSGGVISDPYLESSGWQRWTAGGTLVFRANEKYEIGRTWDFTVTATQQDGILLNDSPDTIWPGQQGALAYVVEVEFTLVSGNLNGAGVRLTWNNTAGSAFTAQKPMADMVTGLVVAGRTFTARAVFKRPSGFSGSFAHHDLYVFINQTSLAPMASKRIKIHKIKARVATDEEAGSGEVMAAVKAELENNYYTKAGTDEAIAGFDLKAGATYGTAWATVQQSATALAGLNGSVARFRNVVTVDGERVAAGIEATAWNTGGATGSLVKLIGDNVVAPGTLSANAMVIGLGGNLLMDPAFDDGFEANWIAAGSLPAAERTIGLRAAGQTYAHPGWPTLMIYQNSGYLDGARYGQIYQRPSSDGAGARYPGVPVTAGKTYIASAYFRTIRCEAQLYLYWYDAAGAQITPSANTGRDIYETGANDKPDSWKRAHIKAVAPANAAYASVSFVKRDTQSGQSNSYLFIWKPQLEEVHAEATEPKPWSPGGTTYINGGRMFAKSIGTRHLDTVDLGVAGLAIFNGDLRSDNFSIANGTGWRITKAGVMNLPKAIIKSAHIDDAQIKSAHIDDLQVKRLHVEGGAITIFERAFTAGGLAAGTSTVHQSLTYTIGRSGPQPIHIAFSCPATVRAASIRIDRVYGSNADDYEVLYAGEIMGDVASGTTRFSHSIIDSVNRSGAITYRLVVGKLYTDRALTTPIGGAVSNRFLGVFNAFK